MSHSIVVNSEDDSSIEIAFAHYEGDPEQPRRRSELMPGVTLVERQQSNGWFIYSIEIDTGLVPHWERRED